MAQRKIHVSVDLDGEIHQVGLLWTRSNKRQEGASFQYETSWLSNKEKFALEPALKLMEGVFHTDIDKNMFGAIGDSAPDRWGRVLMRRAAAHLARRADLAPRTLTELDYLLGVYDEARQGALRFSEQAGGPFLQDNHSDAIPPFIELPKLLAASERLLIEEETEEDIQLLLAPGSSLGGACPKASVRDMNGELSIAKFPRPDDEYSTEVWEALCLLLAERAGLEVPKWRLVKIGNKSVLIIKRFDRNANQRIPFLSAMSMIGARDNEQHSYLELVDALRQYGASPKADIVQLWSRIVFNILVSNTDDHLRNHAFLYQRYKGWRLSPVYDLNPTPIEIKPRILTTTIDFDDGTASLDLALSVAKEFGLSHSQAKQRAKEIALAVSLWKDDAKFYGIKPTEMERMASAFNHNDLAQALLL